MTRHYFPYLLFALCLCACRESGEAEESARVLPSRSTILSKIYDADYTVPDGFYTDARVNTQRSYTLHHVKDETKSYELCADDMDEASAMETADSEGRSVQGYRTDSLETNRYYEFVRELSYASSVGNIGDPTSPGFARVFKCGYVDRSGVDRRKLNGSAGWLHSRPLSTHELAELTQYLWQFTFFNASKKAVLQTFSNEHDGEYTHTLVLAFLNNQGEEACDSIEVADWVFSVDKSSGQLRKRFNELFQFEAEFVDGSPRECAP